MPVSCATMNIQRTKTCRPTSKHEDGSISMPRFSPITRVQGENKQQCDLNVNDPQVADVQMSIEAEVNTSESAFSLQLHSGPFAELCLSPSTLKYTTISIILPSSHYHKYKRTTTDHRSRLLSASSTSNSLLASLLACGLERLLARMIETIQYLRYIYTTNTILTRNMVSGLQRNL